MNKAEILNKDFASLLDARNTSIKNKMIEYKKDGRDDESTLEKIKLNVVGIFKTMLKLAYTNVYVKLNNPNLKAIIESDNDDYEKFKLSYLKLLENITSPWKEKLQKNKDFDLSEKTLIEEVKLCEADLIIQEFIALHASLNN